MKFCQCGGVWTSGNAVGRPFSTSLPPQGKAGCKYIAAVPLVAMVLLLWSAVISVAFEPTIVIDVGKGIALSVPKNTAAVFVADETTADVRSPRTGQFFLFGRTIGSTSVIATDLDGRILLNKTVIVRHDMTAIKRVLNSRFPNHDITVQSAEGSLMVSGDVSDPVKVAEIMETLKPFVGSDRIIDRLTSRVPVRVRLFVRLLDISRSVQTNVGLDLRSLFGIGPLTIDLSSGHASINVGTQLSLHPVMDLNATVDLLVQKKLANIISEPNLSTNSGETAKFRVGGELPLPGDTIQTPGFDPIYKGLSYKFVGMDLKFTPLVNTKGSIKLDIESSITNEQARSLTVDGEQYPEIASRSFSTSIDLAHGQSFVLAGLSQKEFRKTLNAPHNGGGKRAFQGLRNRKETKSSGREILIVVTPYLVGNGVGKPEAVNLTKPLSNIEYIFLQRLPITAHHRPSVHFSGPAGFAY